MDQPHRLGVDRKGRSLGQQAEPFGVEIPLEDRKAMGG